MGSASPPLEGGLGEPTFPRSIWHNLQCVMGGCWEVGSASPPSGGGLGEPTLQASHHETFINHDICIVWELGCAETIMFVMSGRSRTPKPLDL